MLLQRLCELGARLARPPLAPPCDRWKGGFPVRLTRWSTRSSI
jgi:hypothetical protein